jgi:hypothetical protein
MRRGAQVRKVWTAEQDPAGTLLRTDGPLRWARRGIPRSPRRDWRRVTLDYVAGMVVHFGNTHGAPTFVLIPSAASSSSSTLRASGARAQGSMPAGFRLAMSVDHAPGVQNAAFPRIQAPSTPARRSSRWRRRYCAREEQSGGRRSWLKTVRTSRVPMTYAASVRKARKASSWVGGPAPLSASSVSSPLLRAARPCVAPEFTGRAPVCLPATAVPPAQVKPQGQPRGKSLA